MHEKLKFSFGHIFAFLALIYISYTIFTGVTYYLDGEYLVAGGVAIVVAMVILSLLFWLQLLKSVNQRFEKYIKQERVALVMLTVACVAAFIPYSHFWTVKSHEQEIENSFNQYLQTSEQLFADYDEYSNTRISQYENYLSALKGDNTTYLALQKGLRLQLRPQTFEKLENSVQEWLSSSEGMVSVWNIFLIGNIGNLCESMAQWHSKMHEMSVPKMSGESYAVKSEVFDRTGTVEVTVNNLRGIVPWFTTPQMPNMKAWLSGLLAFFMLYLPWIIQRRSPKSLCTLFGKKKLGNGHVLHETTESVSRQKRAFTLSEDHTAQVHEHKGQVLTDTNEKTGPKRRAFSLDPEK